MKLEDQVVSLELAKKMKELGVKQESLFYWIANPAPEHEKFWLGDRDWYEEKKEYADCSSAYTVAELGEMLPRVIPTENLNARFPFITNREAKHEDDDAMIEKENEIMDDFKSVMNELEEYWDYGYEEGINYPIKIDYGTGTLVRYHWLTDEWDMNYEVFEVEGDTEANARAKMLIYLLENNLIEV